MPIFTFEGRREDSGEVVKGIRESASHAMLGQDLLSEGILLTKFEAQRQKAPGATLYSAIFRRVPILERVLFSRYFGLMLRAGLDIKSALATLQEQSRSKPMKEALEMVLQSVERGKSLAESMEGFPNVFSSLFVSFIRVGETTGKLQEALETLAEQLQKEYDLRRAVRGGMLYPIVIVLALIAVGVAMMIFVVPKLVEIFEGFDVELPITTRILIAINDIVQNYWIVILIGLGGLGAVGWFLLRFQTIKSSLLHGLLYVPVIAPIMQKVNLARFSRNLGSLLASGVSFIEALRILGDNTPHPSYGRVFLAAQEHVKKGKNLSDFLGDFERLFPPLVVNVIRVGEETGQLDEVLKEIALFYESEVDQTMKNLTSIMEPVLMIVIGVAVGALAVSIISPIYSLVNVI